MLCKMYMVNINLIYDKYWFHVIYMHCIRNDHYVTLFQTFDTQAIITAIYV